MEIRQFKLANDDEIMCEVVEYHEEDDAIVIRKTMKMVQMDNMANGTRYYAFRPFMMYQMTKEAFQIINCAHIISEANPNQDLILEYFKAIETALDEDEVITAVSFPKPEAASYVKFPNPASRYAMVGVFVAKTSSGVAVAVTGAGQDGVFRHDGLEAALNGSFSADSVDGVAVDDSVLMSDMHASADYRAHLITQMTKRAVAAC